MSSIRGRAKELLPSVLLTLMSIIQALALEFLWEVIRDAERALTWSAVLVWVQITATMLGLLQVWLFYTSVAMRFRWVPAARDLLLPFLIGILEFTMIDLIGTEHMPYWLWTLAVIYAVASWDAQNVFVRARKDPDNSEYFDTIAPAGILDLIQPVVVILGLVLFGIAILIFRDSPWLALTGLMFALGNLAYRIELGRRFWNASMRAAQ